MYLGKWEIDDALTFTIVTHTFATGALTDADAAPTYRVYEDETGTAILNGELAKLDDANTTGHYSEQITLSAANGFEVGKTYSIYITATVSSVAGGTVRSFQVEAAPATAAALATVDGIVDDILVDTAVIGALGAGLTAVPWNAAWDAEVQSEVTDALNAYDPPTNAEMEARTLVAASYFDPAADTVANVTAVGSVTGAVGSVTGAVGSVTGNVGGNVAGSVASVTGAVGSVTAGVTLADDAITAGKFDETTAFPQTGDAFARLGAPAGASVSADIAAIEAQTDDIGVAGAGLTAVPWNAAWDAEVESEVADALGVYDPPTKAELDAAVADVSVDEIQASALADLFNTDSGTTYGAAVAGSAVKEIADNAGGSALTEAGIADAVWDEAIADHVGAGSTGAALNAAGSAGDPWTTELPGSYTGIQAGKMLSDIIVDTAEIGTAGAGLTEAGGTGDQLTAVPWNAAWDAEVESEATDALNAYDPPTKTEMDNAHALLATAAALDTVDNFLDTEIAAILADTNELQADWTDGGRLDLLLDATLADTNELQTNQGNWLTADVSALATSAEIAALNDPTAAAIADAVWDEAATGHTDAGKAGEQLWTDVDAILADTNELQTDDYPTTLATLATAAALATVDTNVDSILADTNELQTNQGNWLTADVSALATSAALATVDTNVDSILEDTGTTLPAAITALNNLSAAEVNAQVLDVLNVDTFAELTGVPADDTTLTNMVRWLYLLARNKIEQTSTTQTAYADDGTTEVASAAVSDDGTTAIRAEWETPN